MNDPVLVVDVGPLWIRLPFEFLGRLTPTVGITPKFHRWRWLLNGRISERLSGWRERSAYLPVRAFGRLSPYLAPMTAWSLRRICPRVRALILTYPHQRHLVDRFRRVYRVYYASDDYRFSYGWAPDTVEAWERHLVGRVDQVVVVSNALRASFQHRYGVEAERIHVSPNGLPGAYIPSRCPAGPNPAPPPVPSHFRPLAGVLGTISSRLRISWLRQAVEALPWLYWAFVGPITEINESQQRDLQALQDHPRCCFTGYRSYDDLFGFAAAFDVAVIPVDGSGINPTSSPVRFFTQLPFGQPILATRGSRQLEEFQPLVRICDRPDALIDALVTLRDQDFNDGLGPPRSLAAREHTWEVRARELHALIAAAP